MSKVKYKAGYGWEQEDPGFYITQDNDAFCVFSSSYDVYPQEYAVLEWIAEALEYYHNNIKQPPKIK